MRVTKVIREYIEDEISAKFDPLIKAEEDRYRAEIDPVIDEAKAIAKEANDRIIEIFRANSLQWEEGIDYISYSTYKTPINKEKFDEKTMRVKALKDRKRDAINDIVLRLELGEATKNELKDLLAAVSVE